MRLTLFALGSRGDVQPYIALGKGLHAAGHDVRVLTHENFADLTRGAGLEFWPARGDVQAFAQSEEMQILLEKGNFLAINARMARESRRVAVRWAEDGLAACQDVDRLLGGLGGLSLGFALSEKLGIPFHQAYLVPFTPTAAFPGALVPASVGRLGGAANRLSHHLTRQIMWQGGRGADREARRALGLPAAPFWGPYRAARGAPVLYGFSPAVIPPPPDWGPETRVTGYWFLDPDEGWSPPSALEAFLDAGPPPVAVGFGSMGDRRPAETTAMVLEALERVGARAVLLSGWGGLGALELPPTVHVEPAVPHAWLFPRVAAVVHHGGAGTTAAGLRAGAPSIVVPFFGDQGFWGRRVAALGVGPPPLPRRRLSADALAAALERVLSDEGMRRRAAALGARIRAEDGLAAAAAAIAEFARDRP